MTKKQIEFRLEQINTEIGVLDKEIGALEREEVRLENELERRCRSPLTVRREKEAAKKKKEKERNEKDQARRIKAKFNRKVWLNGVKSNLPSNVRYSLFNELIGAYKSQCGTVYRDSRAEGISVKIIYDTLPKQVRNWMQKLADKITNAPGMRGVYGSPPSIRYFFKRKPKPGTKYADQKIIKDGFNLRKAKSFCIKEVWEERETESLKDFENSWGMMYPEVIKEIQKCTTFKQLDNLMGDSPNTIELMKQEKEMKHANDT